MIFQFGDAVEQLVIKWLEAAGYRVEGAQHEYTDHDGWFRGHCDGIIHRVSTRPHILEIKSANDSKFKLFREKGIESNVSYYAQAQCYMGYSGLERALFVVMNKNTCEIYTQRIHFDEEVFNLARARARGLIRMEDEPDRTFDRQSTECTWCSMSNVCWNIEEVALSEKTCGMCHYLGWIGCQTVCRHPGHPVKIRQWGVSCPDWQDRFDKGDALPKASNEEIGE